MSPLRGHLPAHMCIFEAVQHIWALLCSALCTYTQPFWSSWNEGCPKRCISHHISPGKLSVSNYFANKLFIFFWCDIKYVLLLFSFTHASTGKWRSSFWGNYGESVFYLPSSVFLTYSLSHHTCKWAGIALQLPTCWLSPYLSLCLFIHNSPHLPSFFISGSLRNFKCVISL